MLKVGITGHTSGLGKYLFDQIGSIGWSKSSGYDLTQIEALNKMLKEAEDCDVFINNAHDGEELSLNVFEKFYSLYKHKPIQLINIASFNQARITFNPKEIETDAHKYYQRYKQFWDSILLEESKCSVAFVELGPTGSQRTLDKQLPHYTSLEDTGKVIINIIEQLKVSHRVRTQFICKGYYV